MEAQFDHKLSYDQIDFQYCRKPAIDDREIHNYHEILFYLDGEATFLTETGSTRLNRNMLLIIPKGHYHFFRLEKPEAFTRIKFSIPADPAALPSSFPFPDRIQIWNHLPEGALYGLHKLQYLLSSEHRDNTPFRAYAAFLFFLSELDDGQDPGGFFHPSGTDETISALIRYISENLSADLSIPALARAMMCSPSTVTHTFQKELGISVHRYVTERRLTYARELLAQNHKPSKLYLDCGYRDYTSFYKAYVRFFGHAPSQETLP